MKKLMTIIAGLLMTITASAQFEAGKTYLGASLSGLDMTYYNDEFRLGLTAQGGYFVADNIMAYGQVQYNTNGKLPDSYKIGVGGRYYILQNGIFLGANLNLCHDSERTDLEPGVEVGYSFFINRTVTIEPAVYYNQSFLSHSKYSAFGIRAGLGIYLFTN